MASSRPLRWVHGPHHLVHARPARSSDAAMTRSGPSATISRSSSVMTVAISTMMWRAGSSPVISRSIQASTSRTIPNTVDSRRRSVPWRGARYPCGAPRRATWPCRPTPGRATPVPIWWPAPARWSRPAGVGRWSRPGPGRHPGGVRRIRAAPQRSGPAPRHHAGQQPRSDRLPAIATSWRSSSSTPTRSPTSRSGAATASPSWWSSGSSRRRSCRSPSCRPRRGVSAASATPGGSRCPSYPRSRPWPGFSREKGSGQVIERAEVAALSALKTYNPPIEVLARPGPWETSRRRGKYLGSSADDLWLVMHLARGGWVQWRDNDAAGPGPSRQGPVGPAGRSVRRWRLRRHRAGHREAAGALGCVATSIEVEGVARLGPDPLDPGFGVPELATLARGSVRATSRRSSPTSRCLPGSATPTRTRPCTPPNCRRTSRRQARRPRKWPRCTRP